MTRRALLVAAAVLGAGILLLAGVIWLSMRGPAESQSTTPAQPVVARYYCPMHPTMVSDRPGDCPICQMRMVPIEEHKPEPAAPAPQEEHEAAVPGLASFRIPLQKQQLIGMKTSVVARLPFRRAIRAVGRVTYDETREHHVTIKTSGYVETLHANAVGKLIGKGEPLLEIYSPELLASQQEYLLALKTRSRTSGSSIPSVAGAGDDLVASARRRLQLFDVSEVEIQELEGTGQPRRTITLHAPISGTLTHRAVTHGDRVEAGTHLMDITDLSRVWVIASVFEYELPFVRVGQAATMSLSYLPGKTFDGRVSLIYPTLDPQTRTIQVRLEFPNPDLLLKPDMFAEVRLVADLGERLGVPDTAVMETGARSIVFVDRGDGLFEPRQVAIGLRLPDAYEVTGGLAEGERVVTSGNFFVDSESKLKAALGAMTEASTPPPEHRH